MVHPILYQSQSLIGFGVVFVIDPNEDRKSLLVLAVPVELLSAFAETLVAFSVSRIVSEVTVHSGVL